MIFVQYDKKIIDKAVKVLEKGELVVYPTDTIYGIGADVTNPDALKRLYEAKQQPMNKLISQMVADFEMLEKYADITDEQRKILKQKLPGAYTFVLKPRYKFMTPDKSNHLQSFRIPNHWCTEIVKKLGKPITCTSANIYNAPVPDNIEDIKKVFGKKVKLYIDGGILKNLPSKVIDLIENKIIR